MYTVLLHKSIYRLLPESSQLSGISAKEHGQFSIFRVLICGVKAPTDPLLVSGSVGEILKFRPHVHPNFRRILSIDANSAEVHNLLDCLGKKSDISQNEVQLLHSERELCGVCFFGGGPFLRTLCCDQSQYGYSGCAE